MNSGQSESVLVQKLFTHFKKTPGTHKLGVLYIVDAVTRKWMEQAKAQGQVVRYDAKDGTPAAGVQKVTELMPLLMNDVISKAPEDQKVRRNNSNIDGSCPRRWEAEARSQKSDIREQSARAAVTVAKRPRCVGLASSCSASCLHILHLHPHPRPFVQLPKMGIGTHMDI